LQEAFVRLLNARREGRLTSAKAFLFTVARNLAIDMFRRRRHAAAHESLSDLAELSLLEEPMDVVSTLERQGRLNILLEAMVALPERRREAMVMRHRDGLAYKEIARRLGIALNTVKVHLMKGVSDCTAFFREQGLFDDAFAVQRVATVRPTWRSESSRLRADKNSGH